MAHIHEDRREITLSSHDDLLIKAWRLVGEGYRVVFLDDVDHLPVCALISVGDLELLEQLEDERDEADAREALAEADRVGVRPAAAVFADVDR